MSSVGIPECNVSLTLLQLAIGQVGDNHTGTLKRIEVVSASHTVSDNLQDCGRLDWLLFLRAVSF